MEESIESIVENIGELFSKPLQQQIQQSESIDNLRTLLEVFNPYKLYNAIVDGVNKFLSEFGEYISNDTHEKMKYTVSELKERAEQLRSVWNTLDEYERNQIWNAIGEGVFSDEAIFGATVGSMILPGIGTAIGAFFGGRSAGKRVASQVKEAVELYCTGVSNYIEMFSECLQKIFLPSILSDFAQIAAMAAEKEENEKKALPDIGHSNNTQKNAIDEIERLAKLKKEGVITDEEFQSMKAKIISNM